MEKLLENVEGLLDSAYTSLKCVDINLKYDQSTCCPPTHSTFIEKANSMFSFY
jgi:hypothetical protein